MRKYKLSKGSKDMLNKNKLDDLRIIKKKILITEDNKKLHELIKNNPDASKEIENLRNKIRLNVNEELKKMEQENKVENIETDSVKVESAETKVEEVVETKIVEGKKEKKAEAVKRMLTEGKTNTEMAEILKTSKASISSMVSRLKKK